MNNTFELQMALSSQQQGDVESAERQYRRIIDQDPEFALAHNYLGSLLANSGRVDESLPILERAVSLDNKNPEAISTLAQVYGALGKFQEAYDAATSLIDLMPLWNQAHVIQASALRFLGRNDEAIAAFNKSIELQGDAIDAHLMLGDLYASMERYNEARNTYETALKIDEKNIGAIVGLGMVLHAMGEIDKACTLYVKASSMAPNDVNILTLLGNVYRDLGVEDKAIRYYEQILRMDPNHSIARDNLANINSSTIRAWHFEMLADQSRNQAYYDAIKEKVKPGHHVLDIGTGSGLLSMMAAQQGAELVTTFEMVGELAKVARTVIADNGLDQKIKVFDQKSTSAIIGDHLPQKVDVLVSEILDTGLLGEGVLPSHRHALAQLTTDDPVVIPRSATVKGMLIQCDAFHSIYAKMNIEGFDMSSFGKFHKANRYVVQKLETIDHKKLTDVTPIWQVDFKQLPPPYTMESPLKENLSFTAEQDGEVHALAFWFDLNLTESICESSGPDGKMVHWGQAVLYFDKAKKVRKGDVIEVTLLQWETGLSFEWLKQ